MFEQKNISVAGVHSTYTFLSLSLCIHIYEYIERERPLGEGGTARTALGQCAVGPGGVESGGEIDWGGDTSGY